MASRPLYIDGGTLTRIGSGTESAGILEIQGIEAITNSSTVALFDDATGTITLGQASSAITLGTTTTDVTVAGNLQVDGTETVTGQATFETTVVFGDGSGTDTVAFDGAVVGTAALPNMVMNTAAAAQAITSNGTNDLTVSTTTSGNLVLSSAVDIDVAPATNGDIDMDVTGTGVVTIDGASTIDITSSAAAVGITGVGLNLEAGTGAFDIQGDAASTIGVTGATLGISTTGANDINLSPGSSLVDVVTTGASQAIDFTSAAATAGIHVYNGDPEGNVTGSVGDICLSTAAGGLLYFCDATGTNWTAVGASTGNTLQEAYAAGNTISATAAEGDIDFTLTSADFAVTTTATGNIAFDTGTANEYYLLTDHSNSQVTIGSTAGATDISVIIPTDVLDVDAADMDFDGTTFNVGAAGALAVAFAATTFDAQASGAVTIDSSGGAIGIGTDADAQAINIGTGAAARTITMGNVTGATAVNINSGTGGVTLASTGTGDLTLDSADDVIVDAEGLVSIDSVGTSYWANDTGNLTISTTNSGTLGLQSVEALDMDGTVVTLDGSTSITVNSSGALDMDGTVVTLDGSTSVKVDSAGTSEFDSATGTTIDALAGGVTIQATAGDIALTAPATSDVNITATSDALSDVNFTAHGLTIPFNATTSTTLNTTAQDIIGALNELKAAGSDLTAPITMAVGVAAAEGDLLYIDASGDGRLAINTTAAQAAVYGVATAAIGAGLTGEVYIVGDVIVSTDISTWTVGQKVYVATTAGDVTNSAPGSNAVAHVGYVSDVGTGPGDGQIVFRPTAVVAL